MGSAVTGTAQVKVPTKNIWVGNLPSRKPASKALQCRRTKRLPICAEPDDVVNLVGGSPDKPCSLFYLGRPKAMCSAHERALIFGGLSITCSIDIILVAILQAPTIL